MRLGGLVGIDFAFQNGKLCSIGSGGLAWRMGTDADLNWLVQRSLGLNDYHIKGGAFYLGK